MAKSVIVGVRTGSYTDKKSGEVVAFCELQVVKTLASVVGHATEELYITSNSGIYDYLLRQVGGKVSEFPSLIGYFINTERTTKGFLNDVELLEHKPDAFVFDF